MANVLVCGGAGYIGSHTVRFLLETTVHRPVVLDNLSMGHIASVPHGTPVIEGDLGDARLLAKVLREYHIDAVMHFAAHLAVGESVADPLKYYLNNVAATTHLLDAMRRTGVRYFVFSSSAAVYGEPPVVPIPEDSPLRPINPYGFTKLFVEQILADCAVAYGISATCLRYFNAAGAHPSGDIGEDHTPESHLIPLILSVALGRRPEITLFGDDYPTRDGSCVRDYVHTVDLASAHVLALDKMLQGAPGRAYNLGNGKGTTVFEVVESCRKATGHPIPTRIAARRPGDPPALVADSSRAMEELGWIPRFSGIDDIVNTAWNWHSRHPGGYGS
ncbi:MAG: UDP-glucose 4-epimerase GalE [Candidatus Brocadiia bacterium]